MTKDNSQNYITPQPAYFSKVKLKGYKSIKDLTIEFKKGLNIVIGPNGSGKTNLLDFLISLGSIGKIENAHSCKVNYQDNVGRDWFYSKNANQLIFEEKPFQKIKETLKIDNEFFAKNKTYKLYQDRESNLDYYFKLKGLFNFHKIEFKLPENIQGLDLAFSSQFLGDKNLDSFQVNSFNTSTNEHIWNFLRLKIISWIKNGLRNLAINKKKFSQRSVSDSNLFSQPLTSNALTNLRKFSPIKNIKIDEDVSVKKFTRDGFAFVNVKFIRLAFFVNDEWVTWDMLSDGTKRLFYIIFSLSFNDHHTKYLIEEPELGIHPHQLYLLMIFLKEKSEENQIIITTHSPQVLNILDGDELDRIIIAKNEKKKGTTLRHLSKREIKKAKSFMDDDGLFLSDYWIHSDLEEQIL